MLTPPKYNQADADQLARFLSLLTPSSAPQFHREYRHRPEFGMYVVDMDSPDGMAVINEFNFKSEEAAKEAIAALDKLLPQKQE